MQPTKDTFSPPVLLLLRRCLENMLVDAACSVTVLSGKCLNRSIVTRAHASRQAPPMLLAQEVLSPAAEADRQRLETMAAALGSTLQLRV